MSVYKKSSLVLVICIILVVAAVITNSFLPTLVKENFELYESHEYAQMYLEDEPYSDLIVELDYVQGRIPDGEAVNSLEERIEEYTDKESVRSELDDTIPYLDPDGPPYHRTDSYTKEDIAELEEEYRDHGREDSTISIYILYLDGSWKDNERALGLAKQPSFVVMFSDVIEDFSERSGVERRHIEKSVLVHEFGHLLSLVGIGYESDHEDPVNQHHCDERAGECVMAAAVEYTGEDNETLPPDDFCELCQKDMERIREMENEFSFAHMITYGAIAGEVVIASVVSVAVITSDDKKSGGKNTTSKPPYPYQNRDGYGGRKNELRFKENDHLREDDEV
ncbi:MAG: hypothetical protein ACOCTR_00660 [Candidatus Natronoplasma sp.]